VFRTTPKHIAELDVETKEKVGMFFKNSDCDYLPDKRNNRAHFHIESVDFRNITDDGDL